MSRTLSLLPLYTQDSDTKSSMCQVKIRGVMTWQVLIFLPRVVGFPKPRFHMTWTFFSIISKKDTITGGGGGPETKHIKQKLPQESDFSLDFLA
jgi:hypothetical protein